MGVSATHIDWTMVPYVRKSFYKHYKDGITYVENIKDWNEDIDITETSIDEPVYTKYSKAYNYAMNMTEREIKQAVEGMYHNANTLQSRSGKVVAALYGNIY